MEFNIRSTTPTDKYWINELIIKEWGSDFIVTAQNKRYMPKDLPGLIAVENNEKVGLLTYVIENSECRIITINSFKQNKGVGSLLLDSLKKLIKEMNLKKIIVETTNDNLNALKFYQKRGFQITTLYPNAMDQVRKIKPQTPLLGKQGIPLRDIIKLELKLI